MSPSADRSPTAGSGGGRGPGDRDERRALLERIRRIDIVTSRKVNEQLAGQYHSVFKGRGMSFDEVRPYQPGDEIRFIDWNVTARTNEAFVKRFVEERELTVMLLVDVSGSLRFGTRAQEKRAVAAELAALLAFSAVKNNDRVGLVLFSDTVEHVVTPRKGKKHALRLVTDALMFQPTGRGTSIDVALRTMSRISARRTICFLISDFAAPVASFEPALRIVARRHDLVPIAVRDPFEDELPDLGLVLAADLETGQEVWVDTASRKVRQNYARHVQARRAEVDDLFRRMKLDAIRVVTGDTYVRPLVQFFELRSRRQG